MTSARAKASSKRGLSFKAIERATTTKRDKESAGSFSLRLSLLVCFKRRLKDRISGTGQRKLVIGARGMVKVSEKSTGERVTGLNLGERLKRLDAFRGSRVLRKINEGGVDVLFNRRGNDISTLGVGEPLPADQKGGKSESDFIQRESSLHCGIFPHGETSSPRFTSCETLPARRL